MVGEECLGRRKSVKDLRGKKYLRPVEASRLLGVTYYTLWTWIKSKKIRAIKTLGGKYRIPVSEVKRLMKRKEG